MIQKMAFVSEWCSEAVDETLKLDGIGRLRLIIDVNE